MKTIALVNNKFRGQTNIEGETIVKVVFYALAIMIILGTGCVSSSRMAYQNQLQEIELSYQAAKITTAEYLTLKQNAENAYRQRKATIAAGVLASP